jgi:hypothetical protein
VSVKKGSKLIFLKACAILILILSYSIMNNVKASQEVVWTQAENPSNGVDIPMGVAVDSSGIYVVGFDNSPGNDEWRIEKRSLTNGAILWTQASNPSNGDDRTFGVAVDSSGIYVVGFDNSLGNGQWKVEKRSLTDGTLVWTQTNNPSNGDDWATSVAVDSSGVYVAGFDNSPGNDEWRIEKRSLADGTLIWSKTDNLSNGIDRPIGVAVDSSGVYVVGFDNSPGNDEWRIEKRSLTDGTLVWTQTNNPSITGDEAIGVAVDTSGIYVVGYDTSQGPEQWRIEKRSLMDGALLWTQIENPSTGVDEVWGVAVGSSGIYGVGSDNSPSPGSDNFEWRIEKRNLTDGAILWNQTENPSNGDDWAASVAVDSSGIYVVGYDTVPGNVEWRIEKISEETTLPIYMETWFTAGLVVVIVAVVLAIVFIMRRKAKLVASTASPPSDTAAY